MHHKLHTKPQIKHARKLCRNHLSHRNSLYNHIKNKFIDHLSHIIELTHIFMKRKYIRQECGTLYDVLTFVNYVISGCFCNENSGYKRKEIFLSIMSGSVTKSINFSLNYIALEYLAQSQ